MGSTEEKQNSSIVTLPPTEVEVPPTEFQIKPENIVKPIKIDGSEEAYQTVEKAGEALSVMIKLAEDTGFEPKALNEVLNKIPFKHYDESDSLETSAEAIAILSEIVDNKYPGMPVHKKTALKLKIMANLLTLKAELLHS